MLQSASHCFKDKGSESYLQYGPETGCKRFRSRLATFLSQEYGYADEITPGVPSSRPVNLENLVVTNGASGSFSNIISIFTHPNKTRVIIENPTYFLAIRVLEDHGISRNDTIKINVDEDGLQVDELERLLDTLEPPQLPPPLFGEKRFNYLLFLVPTFSNPTGITLSLERRRKLVDIARKHDILVVCDDVYHLLHLSPDYRPPPRVVSFDLDSGFGNVISNQSFSKILGPGLRLGWVEAAPGIVRQFQKSGLMYSGGCPSHFVSGIVGSAIETGILKKNLNLLRHTFRERMLFMCEFLEKNMPKEVSWKQPLGGYFLWIKLPETENTTDILRALRETGEYKGKSVKKLKVGFAPGNLFSSDASHGNHLRLTFAHYNIDGLKLGLERLCQVFDQCL